MLSEEAKELLEYCYSLEDRYNAMFGTKNGLAMPFGYPRQQTWDHTDSIREYEIALETGIPFEPGTERWKLYFGENDCVPDGCVV